jgi:oxygen-independent coproporphyrinogen-3 oxidase
MYGYEGCSLPEEAGIDLKLALDEFGCRHASCYQLTFEKNTPFYADLAAGKIKAIEEDREIELYSFINDFLKSKGLLRYEISNYAAPGYESRHNLSYWKYEDYLGVGPGAHGRITINGCKNEVTQIADPDEWSRRCRENGIKNNHLVRELTAEKELREIIIVGLRMATGLKIADICKKIPQNIFQKNIEIKKIRELRKQNLITKNEDFITLTSEGFLKINAVIEFLIG